MHVMKTNDHLKALLSKLLHIIWSARFLEGWIKEGDPQQVKNGHGTRVIICIYSFIKIWYIALGWVHLVDTQNIELSERKRAGGVKWPVANLVLMSDPISPGAGRTNF
jgi:hypothetical protein